MQKLHSIELLITIFRLTQKNLSEIISAYKEFLLRLTKIYSNKNCFSYENFSKVFPHTIETMQNNRQKTIINHM